MKKNNSFSLPFKAQLIAKGKIISEVDKKQAMEKHYSRIHEITNQSAVFRTKTKLGSFDYLKDDRISVITPKKNLFREDCKVLL